MVVFVCSPYGGKPDNVTRAREYCRLEVDNGNAPIAPHLLLPQFMDEKTERWEAIQTGLMYLDVSEEIHVYGEPTEGMQSEIEYAEENGIPIIYMGGNEC